MRRRRGPAPRRDRRLGLRSGARHHPRLRATDVEARVLVYQTAPRWAPAWRSGGRARRSSTSCALEAMPPRRSRWTTRAGAGLRVRAPWQATRPDDLARCCSRRARPARRRASSTPHATCSGVRRHRRRLPPTTEPASRRGRLHPLRARRAARRWPTTAPSCSARPITYCPDPRALPVAVADAHPTCLFAAPGSSAAAPARRAHRVRRGSRRPPRRCGARSPRCAPRAPVPAPRPAPRPPRTRAGSPHCAWPSGSTGSSTRSSAPRRRRPSSTRRCRGSGCTSGASTPPARCPRSRRAARCPTTSARSGGRSRASRCGSPTTGRSSSATPACAGLPPPPRADRRAARRRRLGAHRRPRHARRRRPPAPRRAARRALRQRVRAQHQPGPHRGGAAGRVPLIAQACVIGDRRPHLVALLTLAPGFEDADGAVDAAVARANAKLPEPGPIQRFPGARGQLGLGRRRGDADAQAAPRRHPQPLRRRDRGALRGSALRRELAAGRVDVAAARQADGRADAVLLERRLNASIASRDGALVDRVGRVVRDQVDLEDVRGSQQLRELRRACS